MLLVSQRALRWPRTNLKHFSVSANCLDKFKILFLGRDEFSCLVLQQLYQAQDVWNYIAVATNPDELVSRRGSQLSISPLKLLGESLSLPVHFIPKTKQEFRRWKPPAPFHESELPLDHAIVTASFGRIIPSSVLDLFRKDRRLNIHPSLLPAYRGAAPLQHAILNGERETGVCIIEMLKFSEGIDSGAIWGSRTTRLSPDIMFPDLCRQMALEGGDLLVSVLREMRAGRAKAVPQAEKIDAPRAPLIKFQDSILDFDSMTAEAIIRRHRALSHQRPLTAYLPNKRSLQLHSPTLASVYPVKLSKTPGSTRYHGPSETLTIRCAAGSVLQVPRVKQEAKALLEARAWWNGVKGAGLVIGDEVRLHSDSTSGLLGS
ncbi:formyl transferase [Mycena floridula]|nr:formyl transferase [Mycena floridula]